jgi:CheY-like chemotaxis protein
LVVDDNKIIRSSFCRVLRNVIENSIKNYNIITADDGIDALNLIKLDQKEYKIKCIFTDEYMDYLNGSNTIKIIKELEKDNKINRILLVSISSSDDDMSRLKFLNSGADSVISKPCSEFKLYNTMNELKLI